MLKLIRLAREDGSALLRQEVVCTQIAFPGYTPSLGASSGGWGRKL